MDFKAHKHTHESNLPTHHSVRRTLVSVHRHVMPPLVDISAGVRTVNVVRDRPDLDQLRVELRDLGATVVTTEEALKQNIAAAELPRPRLGLNCVGGSSSAAVAKALG